MGDGVATLVKVSFMVTPSRLLNPEPKLWNPSKIGPTSEFFRPLHPFNIMNHSINPVGDMAKLVTEKLKSIGT